MKITLLNLGPSDRWRHELSDPMMPRIYAALIRQKVTVLVKHLSFLLHHYLCIIIGLTFMSCSVSCMGIDPRFMAICIITYNQLLFQQRGIVCVLSLDFTM
jgi:hypothetical protein